MCSASPFLLQSRHRAFNTDLLQAMDWSNVFKCTNTCDKFVHTRRDSSHLSRHVFCFTGSSSSSSDELQLLSSSLPSSPSSSPFFSSLFLASSPLPPFCFFFLSFFCFSLVSAAFIISLNSLTAAAAASFCLCRLVSSSSPRGGFRYFFSMPCSTC